ncbi:hypothetical protein RRG08_028948 [Elysia crispata]|uniref:Uncharacterized protein n=1 Tax=Elysia crispata TaxID=231223 RepID=A0AAE1AQF4_9GAST|nr:hypothetical protein RRG08_028948 [Elysia crispata]
MVLSTQAEDVNVSCLLGFWRSLYTEDSAGGTQFVRLYQSRPDKTCTTLIGVPVHTFVCLSYSSTRPIISESIRLGKKCRASTGVVTVLTYGPNFLNVPGL